MSHQCLKNSTRVQVSWEIAGSHTQATRQPVARHGRGTPNNTNATAGPHRRRRRLGRGREDEEDAGGCTERHQSQKGMKESSTSSGEHRARHCGDSGWQWQYETHSGSGWQMAPSSAGARCRQSAVGVARRQTRRPSRPLPWSRLHTIKVLYHAAFRSKIACFVIISIRFKATLFLIRSLRRCVRRCPGRRAAGGGTRSVCRAPLGLLYLTGLWPS